MGLLRPVGSKSTRVYWRRRLVVLLPVLAAAVILIWVLTSPSPETPPTAAVTETSAAPLACNPAAVDVDVTAFSSVKAGAESLPFSISLTNKSTQLCVIEIAAADSQITIVSGKDQIWTTADCADWVKPTSARVEPNAKHDWTLDWPLRRSSGCKTTGNELKPGTYWVQVDWRGATKRQAFQIVK